MKSDPVRLRDASAFHDLGNTSFPKPACCRCQKHSNKASEHYKAAVSKVALGVPDNHYRLTRWSMSCIHCCGCIHVCSPSWQSLKCRPDLLTTRDHVFLWTQERLQVSCRPSSFPLRQQGFRGIK